MEDVREGLVIRGPENIIKGRQGDTDRDDEEKTCNTANRDAEGHRLWNFSCWILDLFSHAGDHPDCGECISCWKKTDKEREAAPARVPVLIMAKGVGCAVSTRICFDGEGDEDDKDRDSCPSSTDGENRGQSSIVSILVMENLLSTIGRKLLPKVQITSVIRQIAKKISVNCQLVIVKSGWYMDTVAAIKDAKPKLTESVIVQLPISQIHPVMKLKTVLFLFAIWKDQSRKHR